MSKETEQSCTWNNAWKSARKASQNVPKNQAKNARQNARQNARKNVRKNVRKHVRKNVRNLFCHLKMSRKSSDKNSDTFSDIFSATCSIRFRSKFRSFVRSLLRSEFRSHSPMDRPHSDELLHPFHMFGPEFCQEINQKMCFLRRTTKCKEQKQIHASKMIFPFRIRSAACQDWPLAPPGSSWVLLGPPGSIKLAS